MSARISSAVARHLSCSSRVAADLGELRGAIERDPAHQLRRDVVLRLAARLPDALVGLAPDLGRALGLRLRRSATAAAAAVRSSACAAGSSRAPRRTRRSGAGRTRRCRSAPAGRRRSPERSSRVDSVRSRRPSMPYMICSDPSSFGSRSATNCMNSSASQSRLQPVQRLQREGRVAHPRVAVVPVALAAGRLGQRGRQRGDRRAGRHVGQALDRERRALDRVAPAVVGDARASEPRAPEARRSRRSALGVVVVGGRRELLGPRERAVGPCRPPRGRAGRARGCPRSRAARSVREPDRLARAGRVGRVAVAVEERPLGRRPAVVERRLADELDLDAGPRGIRPSARACGRRRRRPAAACAV